MPRRINIVLSEECVRILDRLAPRGGRSRYIEGLVKKSARERMELRRLLKERALRRFDFDRRTVAEWDALSEEVWRKIERA